MSYESLTCSVEASFWPAIDIGPIVPIATSRADRAGYARALEGGSPDLQGYAMTLVPYAIPFAVGLGFLLLYFAFFLPKACSLRCRMCLWCPFKRFRRKESFGPYNLIRHLIVVSVCVFVVVVTCAFSFLYSSQSNASMASARCDAERTWTGVFDGVEGLNSTNNTGGFIGYDVLSGELDPVFALLNDKIGTVETQVDDSEIITTAHTSELSSLATFQTELEAYKTYREHDCLYCNSTAVELASVQETDLTNGWSGRLSDVRTNTTSTLLDNNRAGAVSYAQGVKDLQATVADVADFYNLLKTFLSLNLDSLGGYLGFLTYGILFVIFGLLLASALSILLFVELYRLPSDLEVVAGVNPLHPLNDPRYFSKGDGEEVTRDRRASTRLAEVVVDFSDRVVSLQNPRVNDEGYAYMDPVDEQGGGGGPRASGLHNSSMQRSSAWQASGSGGFLDEGEVEEPAEYSSVSADEPDETPPRVASLSVYGHEEGAESESEREVEEPPEYVPNEGGSEMPSPTAMTLPGQPDDTAEVYEDPYRSLAVERSAVSRKDSGKEREMSKEEEEEKLRKARQARKEEGDKEEDKPINRLESNNVAANRRLRKFSKFLWCGALCPLSALALILSGIAFLIALWTDDLCFLFTERLMHPSGFDDFIGPGKSFDVSTDAAAGAKACLAGDGDWGTAAKYTESVGFQRSINLGALDTLPTSQDETRLSDLLSEAQSLDGKTFEYRATDDLLPAAVRASDCYEAEEDESANTCLSSTCDDPPGLWTYNYELNQLTGDSPDWAFTSLTTVWQGCSGDISNCRAITQSSPDDTSVSSTYNSLSISEMFRIARLKESILQDAFPYASDGTSTALTWLLDRTTEEDTAYRSFASTINANSAKVSSDLRSTMDEGVEKAALVDLNANCTFVRSILREESLYALCDSTWMAGTGFTSAAASLGVCLLWCSVACTVLACLVFEFWMRATLRSDWSRWQRLQRDKQFEKNLKKHGTEDMAEGRKVGRLDEVPKRKEMGAMY
uniref:Uncharacterized protein n=1 Tax=Chromera velia CCMP2878 TaxID=1169474 RepID=A0A0G4GZU7_9ALVE|eukprot:Cvel_24069.t1-p1 / transcript=Cvel_24069.t1 / gene=Cvel_24069 / organism=Chromera_velia_CCMP2878 / gene_product=hypothetical protein / transcript_product=hypothetical protein / location=Cvel_scaffold2562:934-6739(-) / protein_length=1015 / sequence_SO=supercontig / SO=protein_coding / is_pseudo=false